MNMDGRSLPAPGRLFGPIVARCSSLDVHWIATALVFLVTVDFRFRPMEGMPSFTVAELGAYAVALLYFGHFAVRGISWKTFLGDAYRDNREIFWYFGWVAVALVAGLARSKPIVPFVKDLLPALVLYLVMVYSIRQEKHLGAVIGGYLAGMTVNGILGAVQAATNSYYFGRLHDITLQKTDPFGTIVENMAMGFLSHPNGYAVFIMPAILLVAFLIRFRFFKGVSRNAFLLSLLCLLLYNLYRTYSKGALAWTLLGLVLLAILPHVRERWRYPVSVLALVLGIVSLVSLGVWLSIDYSESFGTVIGRLVYWREGIATLFGSAGVLFFGGGSGEMEGSMLGALGNPMNHAHNGYLNQGLNFGAPAMLFFTIAVLRQMKKGGVPGANRKTPDPAGIHRFRYFFLAVFAAYFGEYFFEPAQLGVSLQALTFFLFALATSISGMEGDRADATGA
jgi:hypothetical protein